MRLTRKQKFWIRVLPYLGFFILVIYYLISSTYYLYSYVFYYPCTSNILQSCDVYKKILDRSNTCRIRVDWRKGIMTDICNCNNSAWFEIAISTKRLSILEIIACASESGEDGVNAIVFINQTKDEFFIPPNSCVKKELKLSTGYFIIKMQPEKFGTCDHEWIYWKSMRLG